MSTQDSSLIRLYQGGDKIMIGVIWFLFVMSLGLANWYNTWTEALWIGLPSALVPTALFLYDAGTINYATCYSDILYGVLCASYSSSTWND